MTLAVAVRLTLAWKQFLVDLPQICVVRKVFNFIEKPQENHVLSSICFSCERNST